MENYSETSLLGYDLHCHYFPGDMPRWAEKFVSDYPFFWIRHGEAGCASCAMMMRGMKEFRSLGDSRLWEPERYLEQQLGRGIEVMALSPTPQNFYYDAPVHQALEIARFQNDAIARLQSQHPKNFRGLGTVPLQEPELACRELERCVQELGLCGIEIGSSCCGEDLSEARFFQVFETAARCNACVFVHPWYFPQEDRLSAGWGNWMLAMPFETATAIFKLGLARITERLPSLRIGFAHGGGSFAWLLDRIVHGVAVRPEYFPQDIDFEKFSRSIFYDSHVCSTLNLKYLIEKVGADQIMAGSDWPYPLGEADLRQFITSLNDPTTARTILVDTPSRFLGGSSGSY